MRRFHSYGPVDKDRHFCVSRRELVDRCCRHLIDDPAKGGHFFTVWAPRQTGKTWLMREVKQAIAARHPGRFQIAMMSMQGVVLEDGETDSAFLKWTPELVRRDLGIEIPVPRDWKEWIAFFEMGVGPLEKPLILFIDEFDSLPPQLIDRLVSIFRDIYLNRDSYLLHGLALIGVRAVLGVGSDRGSPFNVQRSLHVPNFTREEVALLFQQYAADSGQPVDSAVVGTVFEVTRGQPGLVGWFGELLTEKFNPGDRTRSIGLETWERVWHAALNLEWNNTVLNLVKKARGRHIDRVVALFSVSDMRFRIDEEWCADLYLNGIIDAETSRNERGGLVSLCRFSSPFIQERLFNALTDDIAGDRTPILALDPLDDLKGVVTDQGIDLPALLGRYTDYLNRLEQKGIAPWRGLPRRSDLHLTEAAGHVHLYAWLREALACLCTISPEFPTGNGRVDLHIRCGSQEAIIEVKSFRSQARLTQSVDQAARYAGALGRGSVCVALFVPTRDESVLSSLSGAHHIEGVRVDVAAIGWG